MSTPLVGHLDPQFLTIMDEVGEMLRTVFRTENELTFAASDGRKRWIGKSAVKRDCSHDLVSFSRFWWFWPLPVINKRHSKV